MGCGSGLYNRSVCDKRTLFRTVPYCFVKDMCRRHVRFVGLPLQTGLMTLTMNPDVELDVAKGFKSRGEVRGLLFSVHN